MNALFINPPEYTFFGFHNIHTYPIDLYNWATMYKKNGNDVDMFDMYPELANSKIATNVDGILCYDGVQIVEDTGALRACGNYENEKLMKGVLKTGLPYSLLDNRLKEKTYDEIVICALGSKTGVSSTSWVYIYMGVYDVINRCKELQPKAKIILIGEFAKICPDVGQESLADIVAIDPAPARHFVDTDLSLFEHEIPNRINLATSYGCGNCCGFCSIPRCEWSHRTEKPVKDCINYINKVVKQGHTKFRLLDSNVLNNWDNHMKPILEGIKELPISITSYGGVEPKHFTEDKALLMKEAGFTEINVPLDNSDPKILKEWGGKKTVGYWEKAVDIAVKHFDTVYSYIMVGYSKQTYRNLTESIAMCEAKGSTPSLLPYTPIPGTMYEDKKRNPEELHPLLFPYASKNLTVSQIEDLLETKTKWYTKCSVAPEDTVQTKRIYKSSPAIPINKHGRK